MLFLFQTSLHKLKQFKNWKMKDCYKIVILFHWIAKRKGISKRRRQVRNHHSNITVSSIFLKSQAILKQVGVLCRESTFQGTSTETLWKNPLEKGDTEPKS